MKDYNEMAASVFERRDAYIAEKMAVRSKIRKGMACAACCCLAALLGVGALNGSLFTADDLSGTSTPGIHDMQTAKVEGSDTPQATGSISADAPANKHGSYVESSALAQETAAFFGGSYTDAGGNLVVVLTVNTAENRAAVCAELGISEGGTVFETGTYTLAYLTELQDKISLAMINGELPFVVSSGVYEPGNRVRVRVTTTDEEKLAKLIALDPIGGAIRIEPAEAAAAADFARR